MHVFCNGLQNLEAGIVNEADWTGWDTSKRQELLRFKHALPLPTSMESGMVFQKQESLDRPLAVPYSIKEKRPPKGGTPTMRPLIHLPHQWLIPFSSADGADFRRLKIPFSLHPSNFSLLPSPFVSFALLVVKILIFKPVAIRLGSGYLRSSGPHP